MTRGDIIHISSNDWWIISCFGFWVGGTYKESRRFFFFLTGEAD